MKLTKEEKQNLKYIKQCGKVMADMFKLVSEVKESRKIQGIHRGVFNIDKFCEDISTVNYSNKKTRQKIIVEPYLTIKEWNKYKEEIYKLDEIYTWPLIDLIINGINIKNALNIIPNLKRYSEYSGDTLNESSKKIAMVINTFSLNFSK